MLHVRAVFIGLHVKIDYAKRVNICVFVILISKEILKIASC